MSILAMSKDICPFDITSRPWGILRVVWDIVMTLNQVIRPKKARIFASVHLKNSIIWRYAVWSRFSVFVFSTYNGRAAVSLPVEGVVADI